MVIAQVITLIVNIVFFVAKKSKLIKCEVTKVN